MALRVISRIESDANAVGRIARSAAVLASQALSGSGHAAGIA